MKRYDKEGLAILAVILLVAGGLVFAGTQLASGDSPQTATCPDGQTLSWVKVGGDTFKQGKPLPEGASVTDSVSGSGLDYTVSSDSGGATLAVHGSGSAKFVVGCR